MLFLGEDGPRFPAVGGKERQFAPYGDLVRFPLQSCAETMLSLRSLVCFFTLFKPRRVLGITEPPRLLH